MRNNANKKTIEEQILDFYEQGNPVEKIKNAVSASPEAEHVLSIIEILDHEGLTVPDGKNAFASFIKKLPVTPDLENRSIIEEGDRRNSFINQLIYIGMKTKIVLGATIAAIVIIAAGSGYILMKNGKISYENTPVAQLDVSGAPGKSAGETAVLKASDVSLQNSDELVSAIISMADQEFPEEDLYTDIELVSLDANIINDIYNAYDENQL